MAKESKKQAEPRPEESGDKPVIMNVEPGMTFQPFVHLDRLNGSATIQVQVESVGGMILQARRLRPKELASLDDSRTILLGSRYDMPVLDPVWIIVRTPLAGRPLPRTTLKITDSGCQEERTLIIQPPSEGEGEYAVTSSGHQGPVVTPADRLQSLSIKVDDLSTNA